ncbi:MAG: nucleotidyltransferase domain-containing protein [Candidatus Jordarchaeum sp.]|uniref:nucleotidyltransferase domain-containing protein n=1 Tax=Candidatus Jordarchaeum sp. TaxID=2823881 RepID=UPI00404B143F
MDLVEKVKRDFGFLTDRRDVLAVLLYGSQASGESTPRSDVDICVVAPEADRDSLFRTILRHVREPYDVKIFESLPMYLKIQVIRNHIVVYAREVLDLYEYFYTYRKLWKDQERRNTLTKEDIETLLK